MWERDIDKHVLLFCIWALKRKCIRRLPSDDKSLQSLIKTRVLNVRHFLTKKVRYANKSTDVTTFTETIRMFKSGCECFKHFSSKKGIFHLRKFVIVCAFNLEAHVF